jgi:hypothetical protein
VGEVVGFKDKSQQLTRAVKHTHNGIEVVLNFDPTTQLWGWEWSIQISNTFRGTRPELKAALKESTRQIDIITGEVADNDDPNTN